MSTLKYAAYGSSVALFGNTELASMPNTDGAWGNGGGLTSNVWDNTSLLYPEADVIVNLGSISPSSGGFMLLAFQWSPDGTNYPDPQFASGQNAANVPNIGTPIFQQALVTGASAKILVFPSVKLRPGKAKILLVNQSGVTLAATGNSATMYPATFTIA
jgi:hypothetical protein